MSVWRHIVRWWNNQDAVDYWLDAYKSEIEGVRETITMNRCLQVRCADLAMTNVDLSVLLENAPMLDIPHEPHVPNQRYRLQTMRSPFVYLHPSTFDKWVRPHGDVNKGGRFVVPGSPTQYVLTPVMPLDRMLLSPRELLSSTPNGK